MRLQKYLAQAGIASRRKAEELIAFGDGHNDASLLSYAGIAVAMENAVEDLKTIADYITLSNNEDGIAVALEKYL